MIYLLYGFDDHSLFACISYYYLLLLILFTFSHLLQVCKQLIVKAQNLNTSFCINQENQEVHGAAPVTLSGITYAPICSQAVKTLWIVAEVSANYRVFIMLSANYTVVAVNSLLSVYLAVAFSFSFVLFLSVSSPHSRSLSPSGPLLWPINRPAGGDGGPLRETEHFSWFPEKGNDRPRQYPVLHLLRTPSVLLTRFEANTQRTSTVSAQVIQLMSRWMGWDVLITCPNFSPLAPDPWLCLLRAKKMLQVSENLLFS